jgi:eukaryotic-like serine/threonine-protein kinase
LANEAKAADTSGVLVGDKIAGRYRLLRRLAAGGMGEVWSVRNELTNRDFAIKFLLTEFASNDQAFNRFVREAETTGKLQHPSIVDVFDVAQTEDGRPFIVMELLMGEGLDERLRREGTLAPLTTASYCSQIAMALDLAHRAGIIHRDLSSSNIFLARSPHDEGTVPKILDFGISKNLVATGEGQFQTCHGAVLGNPLYMSPEQACGAEQVDARTDVWSMGVLMYQCLTGMTPFRSRNYNALMVEIMTRPHRPLVEASPSVDRELAAIVEGCLMKDRTQRIRSARELAERLSAVAHRFAKDASEAGRTPRRRATDRLPSVRGSIPAPKPGTSRIDGLLPVRSNGLRLVSAAGVAGLIVGAIFAYLLASPSSEDAKAAAEPAAQSDDATSAAGAALKPAVAREVASGAKPSP